MNYTHLGISAFLMLAIDYIYLNLVSKHFNHQVSLVQGSPIQMNYVSAAICYMMLYVAWYYFIIYKNASYVDALLLGALIYGIFETTNKAILTKWNWDSVIIDTLWGGVLFALLTYVMRTMIF